MAGETQYQITGDASRFAGAMDQAAEAAEQMESSLGSLESKIGSVTKGTLEYDQAVGRFRDSSGRFVSSTEAQEAALSELRDENIRTEEQINQQIEKLEGLRDVVSDDAVAVQDLSQRISDLRGELRQAEAATQQSEQAARQLQQGFGSGVEATSDFAQRQSRLQQELRATAAAQEQVASSGVTMRSSVQASASNLSIEMTQAAQDAQFGVAGLANQIPLMSEQFDQLRAKTGSTSGAIDALIDSFMGPAGLLAAGTLLLQMAPQIISFFTDTEEAAKRAGEAYKSAADEFFQLADVDVRGQATVDQLMRQRDRVESAIENLQKRRRLLGATAGGGPTTLEQRQQLDQVNNRLDRYLTLQEKIKKQLRDRRQQLQLVRDAQGDLLKRVEQVSPENRLIEFGQPNLDAELDLSTQLRGLEKRLSDANEKGAQLQETVSDLGQTIQTKLGAEPIERVVFRQERYNEAIERSIARMERLFELRKQLEAVGMGGIDVRRPARAPTRGPNQATVPTNDRGFVKGTAQIAQRLRNETAPAVDQAGNEIDNQVNQQIAQGIQLAGQLGSTLVQSAQQGGAEFEQIFGAILQTVGSVLAVIGNPIGGALLSSGGGFISSLASGGTVGTPLQLVGEEGPELAALPQGTRVFDHKTTAQMMQSAPSKINIETSVKRLPGGDLGLVVRENESRREALGFTD